MIDPNCPKCKGEGWVCESHPDAVAHKCPCGGAGMPCTCHPLHEDHEEKRIYEAEGAD